MNTVGLITEYNPLHNGHIYHLNEARVKSGAEIAIAVMSGNFVQRGEPAVIDKYSRAKAAVDSGVNLVVELPAFYALSSAEGFAAGAVLTLEALGASSFVFGSECGDINLLEKCAEIFINEPSDFQAALKNNLSLGHSYPKARHMALSAIYGNELSEIADSPNNILGIEYIKAVRKYNLAIRPLTIKRVHNNYHDTSLDNEISSATAIRGTLANLPSGGISSHISYRINNDVNNNLNNNINNNLNDDINFAKYMPQSMFSLVNEKFGLTAPITAEDFSMLLNYKIADIMYKCGNVKEAFCNEMCRYIDMTQDLANRLFTVHKDGMTFSEYADALKNRQYTMTRIQRLLMHIILEFTVDLKVKYESGAVPYIRILGIDNRGREYLNSVKKSAEAPIITKTANYKQLLSEDIYAASIYNQAVAGKYKQTAFDEFRQGVYIKN